MPAGALSSLRALALRAGLVALACSAGFGVLTGCTTTAATSESAGNVEKQLVAQADAWDRAIVRKDRAAIEANVGAGFFHVGGDGSTSDRDEFIADLLDPQLVIEPYVVEGLTVRLFGDTALLSATTRMTGSYAGKHFSSHYRYVDTYVRDGGRWHVVAVQITPIARSAAAPKPD